jgi:hypothetical protein
VPQPSAGSRRCTASCEASALQPENVTAPNQPAQDCACASIFLPDQFAPPLAFYDGRFLDPTGVFFYFV